MDPREELQALRRMAELEQRARASEPNPYEGMGAPRRFYEGIKGQADSDLTGVLNLIPGYEESPESKARRASYEKNKDKLGTAGTMGELAFEVGTTAVPMAKGAALIGKGAKYLPKAMQFLGSSIPAGALSAGTISAALAPEDRGQAFVGGAAGGAAGEVGGRLLTKALGGVVSDSVTPEARKLAEMGVNAPMWKATDNKTLRGLAERAKVLPIAGDIIRGQERAAFEDFNRVMAGKASPPMPIRDEAGNVLRWEYDKPVKAAGNDAMKQLKGRFDDAYGALYEGRGIPIDQTYGSQVADILRNADAYYPRISGDVAAASRQADDILRAGTESTTRTSPILSESGQPFTHTDLGHAATRPESVKQAIDTLEGRIESAYKMGDAEQASVLKDLRDQLTGLRERGLPPEVSSNASEINKAYATFKQLQRANSGLGAQKQGMVTPAQQLNAIRAMDRTPNKSAFASGRALNQEEALLAEKVLGNRLPETGPGTAEKLAPFIGFGAPMLMGDLGATALLGTRTGQRALMGLLPGQAGIREYGTKYLVPTLRALGADAGN